MIKWIDKRSVLRSGKTKYRAGDVIPADVLTQSRIDYLIEIGKVKIEPLTGEIKAELKLNTEIEKQEKVQPEEKTPEKKTVKKGKAKSKPVKKEIEPEVEKENFDFTGMDSSINEVTDESPEE